MGTFFFFFEKPMKYALTSYRVGILIRTLELISVCVSLWFTPLFITLEQLLMAAVKKHTVMWNLTTVSVCIN